MLESIEKFITYYNNERPHSYLGYKAPAEAERLYYEKTQNDLDMPGPKVAAFSVLFSVFGFFDFSCLNAFLHTFVENGCFCLKQGTFDT